MYKPHFFIRMYRVGSVTCFPSSAWSWPSVVYISFSTARQLERLFGATDCFHWAVSLEILIISYHQGRDSRCKDVDRDVMLKKQFQIRSVLFFISWHFNTQCTTVPSCHMLVSALFSWNHCKRVQVAYIYVPDPFVLQQFQQGPFNALNEGHVLKLTDAVVLLGKTVSSVYDMCHYTVYVKTRYDVWNGFICRSFVTWRLWFCHGSSHLSYAALKI